MCHLNLKIPVEEAPMIFDNYEHKSIFTID